MSAMMMTLGSWLCLVGGTCPSWMVSDTTGVVDKVVQGWVGLLEYCVVSKLTFTRTCWHHDNWEVCLACVLFCCLPGLICVLCLLCCCNPPMKFLGKISLLAGAVGVTLVILFMQNTEKMSKPAFGVKLTSYGWALYAFCLGSAMLVKAGWDALTARPNCWCCRAFTR